MKIQADFFPALTWLSTIISGLAPNSRIVRAWIPSGTLNDS